jgi:hypothetical protein
LPETCPTPFITRRQRRDEKDENDAHSIEIKIARDNEIRVDQTCCDAIMRKPTSA